MGEGLLPKTATRWNPMLSAMKIALALKNRRRISYRAQSAREEIAITP